MYILQTLCVVVLLFCRNVNTQVSESQSSYKLTLPVTVDGKEQTFHITLDPLCDNIITFERIAINAGTIERTATDFATTHGLGDGASAATIRLIQAVGTDFKNHRKRCTVHSQYGNTDTLPVPTVFGFDIFIHDPAKRRIVSKRIFGSSGWEDTKSRVLWQRIQRAHHNRGAAIQHKTTNRDRLVFLDIGGHIGWYTLLASLAGSKVIVFEPNQMNTDLMQRSVRTNHLEEFVQIVPYAASASVEHRGCHTFVLGMVVEDWVDELTAAATMPSSSSSSSPPRHCPPNTTEIKLTTIDHVIGKDVQIFAMKLDTEGFETTAMYGAQQLLKDPHRRPCVIYLEYIPDRAPPNKAGQRYELFANLTLLHGYEAFMIPEPHEAIHIGLRAVNLAGTTNAVRVTLNNMTKVLSAGMVDFELLNRNGRCNELLLAEKEHNNKEATNSKTGTGPGVFLILEDRDAIKSVFTRQFVPHDQVLHAKPKVLAKQYAVVHGLYERGIIELLTVEFRRKLNTYKRNWGLAR